MMDAADTLIAGLRRAGEDLARSVHATAPERPYPIRPPIYEMFLAPDSYEGRRYPEKITAKVAMSDGSDELFFGPDAMAKAHDWLAAEGFPPMARLYGEAR